MHSTVRLMESSYPETKLSARGNAKRKEIGGEEGLTSRDTVERENEHLYCKP